MLSMGVENFHRHRLLVSAPPRRRDRLFRVSSTCSLRGRGDSLVPSVTPRSRGMDTGSRHQSRADLFRGQRAEAESTPAPSFFIRCRWGPPHEPMG